MKTINVQVAIMSHISDAQFEMAAGMTESARRHISFAKLLVLKYENTDVYETQDKLDSYWESVDNL